MGIDLLRDETENHPKMSVLIACLFPVFRADFSCYSWAAARGALLGKDLSAGANLRGFDSLKGSREFVLEQLLFVPVFCFLLFLRVFLFLPCGLCVSFVIAG